MLRKLAGGRSPLYLAAAALLGLVVMLTMDFPVMITARNDFAHFYIGAALTGSPEFYSREANEAMQMKLMGAYFNQAINIRLPFYGLLLKPLTWLEYKQAYVLFQLLSLACFGVFLYYHFPRYRDLVLLGLMSPPLMANLVNGQDVTLLLALTAVSLALAAKGKDFAGGLALSLCAIKPHLFFLVPAAALLKGRPRFLAGGAAGGATLVLISMYAGGVDFLPRLLRVLPDFNPHPEIMPNVRILYYPFLGQNSAAYLVLAALVVGLTLYVAWKAPSFEVAFAYCLIGGQLASPHSYIQDCLLILLAATILLPQVESKLVRGLVGVAITPVAYFFLQNGPPYSFAFGCLQLSILAAGAWVHTQRATEPAMVTAVS